MSQDNKNVVTRWFKEFWGNPWNPRIVNELATSDIFVHYPMHEPKKGRAAVTHFMTEFRNAFPDLDFRGVGSLIAEDDYAWADGRVVVPTPGQPSVTSAWVRSPLLPVER